MQHGPCKLRIPQCDEQYAADFTGAIRQTLTTEGSAAEQMMSFAGCCSAIAVRMRFVIASDQEKQMTKKNSYSSRMSFGGIVLGLSWITLFLAAFVPGMELSLFLLSTFYVVLVIKRTSITNGWIFYAASCLLSLAIVPNKAALLPYIFFFGLYGLAKYYIEKIGKRPIEYVLKLLFFNASFGALILLFKSAFLASVNIPDLPTAILVIGAQFMFLLYDEILTRLNEYFVRRFGGVMGGRM